MKKQRKHTLTGRVKIFICSVYEKQLIRVVKYSKTVIAITIGIFMFAMWAFGWVPMSFFPDSDRNILVVSMEMPEGTSYYKMQCVVNDYHEFIESHLIASEEQGGIKKWLTFLGGGAPRFVITHSQKGTASNLAEILLTTSGISAHQNIIDQLIQYGAKHYPDLYVKVAPLSKGPTVKFPISVHLLGNDTSKLNSIGEELQNYLREIPGITNVINEWDKPDDKLVIKVDSAKAILAKVTHQDIAASLYTTLSGIQLSQLYDGDLQIPIVLHLTPFKKDIIKNLETIPVFSQHTGNNVPLKQVADVTVKSEFAKIFKYNGKKSMVINADVSSKASIKEINEKIDVWAIGMQSKIDPGYEIRTEGIKKESGNANQAIMVQLPLFMLIILLLLVWYFNSFQDVLITVLTFPLALIGVSFGLNITELSMGFITFVGIVALFGIIINHAILMIEKIEDERINRSGEISLQRVIVNACSQRLHPILLTTFTTIGGLSSLWLFGGPLFESMAVAMIFGLGIGTIFTLFFIPAICFSLYQFQEKGVYDA